MCTIIEKDLRELQIRRATRVVLFRRACRLRGKHPRKVTSAQLTALRNLITRSEEEIAEFKQQNMK